MRNKFQLGLIGLLLLIISPNLVFAYSIFETYLLSKTDVAIGSFSGCQDARAASMGGATVAWGERMLDVTVNPAALHSVEGKYLFQSTFAFTRNHERRSLALYDSYDGFIDDGTYVTNSNYHPEFSIGAGVKLPVDSWEFGVGIAFTPFINFESKYEEEVRNDASSDDNTFPPVIANNLLEGTGRIDSYSTILSAQRSDVLGCDKIALGLNLTMLKGDFTLKKEITWTGTARELVGTMILPDMASSESYDYDGMRLGIGSQVQVNHRLALGFAYSPKTEIEVKDKNKNSITDQVIHPASYNFGIVYFPRNSLKTQVQMGMELLTWSDISDRYDDGIKYSIGIEHKVIHKLPFRFGFSYQTAPQDDGIVMPTVSVGSGYKIFNNIMLDIAFDFTHRKYYTSDLFADSYYDDRNYSSNPEYKSELWNKVVPGDRGMEYPDHVDENFVKGKFSLSYSW